MQLADRKQNSIGWGFEDFLSYEQEDYTLTKKQAKAALADMMRHADASIGITWDTVQYYITQHGTPRINEI